MNCINTRKLFSTFLILILVTQTIGGVLFLPRIEEAKAVSNVTYSCCVDSVASDGNIVENFEDSTQWTSTSANTTLSNDTVNFKDGAAGLKLTSHDVDAIWATRTISDNFSQNNSFLLWVYVPDATNVSNIVVFISSSATFAKYYQSLSAVGKVVSGWNRIILYKSQFTNISGDSWDNVMVRLRVRFNLSNTANFTGTFDKFAVDTVARPKVIITFDDERLTQYTNAFPILKNNNQRATLFIYPNGLNSSVNYMNLSQLRHCNKII